MAEVAVARLRLRASPDRAGLAAHRLTDALRLAPNGAERLLLVRRLEMGRMSPGARPVAWQARTADALAASGSRAKHALEAAPDDEAVWFRSAAEARALLLRELAAGRRPAGWFWRLAVPDWEGLPLDTWLPRWIEAVRLDPREEAALARAVVAVAEAGRFALVAACVADASPAGRLSGGSLARPTRSTRATPAPPAAADEAPSWAAGRRAAQVLARLPPTARYAILEAITAPGADARAASWIARVAVLATTPEAAGASAVLAETAEAVLRVAGRAASLEAEAPPAEDRIAAGLQEIAARTSPTREEPSAPEDVAARATAARETAAPPVRAATESLPHDAGLAERPSPIAGLFLTVGPLLRMGIADWLEARPVLVAEGFGRALLRTIARRMGATAEDTALAALVGEEDSGWAGDLTAWRVGLDRWLRRSCRMRLAELIRKRGSLLLADETLDVRFSPTAADVRLRRRALDLDPQWVPWLGLVVRYHYRDDPLQ